MFSGNKDPKIKPLNWMRFVFLMAFLIGCVPAGPTPRTQLTPAPSAETASAEQESVKFEVVSSKLEKRNHFWQEAFVHLKLSGEYEQVALVNFLESITNEYSKDIPENLRQLGITVNFLLELEDGKTGVGYVDFGKIGDDGKVTNPGLHMPSPENIEQGGFMQSKERFELVKSTLDLLPSIELVRITHQLGNEITVSVFGELNQETLEKWSSIFLKQFMGQNKNSESENGQEFYLTILATDHRKEGEGLITTRYKIVITVTNNEYVVTKYSNLGTDESFKFVPEYYGDDSKQ